jgi:hypothetical protein
VYTPGLENWLLLCSELVPNCCNDAGILYCAVHMYHTHIRCPNYCHDMCICQAIVIQKSLKFTFIHPVWRFDCLHALNLCQTASMTEVFWNMLFAGTPHIFGLPTTAIACVFVKQQTPKKRSNCRLYTRARELVSFMLSTCAKLLRWCWYFGICCTQVPHTYSVSQLLPSHVYLPSHSHPRIAEIDVCTPGLENWLLLCCQLVPNCFNDGGILD